jgi:CRP-like cAMP-binding protein
MSLVRQQLRILLAETGGRMGLGPAAVEEIVSQCQLGQWRKRQPIFRSADTSDLINFLVAGAVKVTCPTGEGTVCVQIVRPGQFFGLNWYPDRSHARQFTAIAFTDCTVGMVTSETMARVIATAPPRAVLQMFTYSWRALSGLLFEKCCLLGLRLEDRLLHELGVVARDFGQPRPDGGVAIDLPLTHADLGELALGSRANVARAMKKLERQGLVAKEGRRIILAGSFFDAGRKHMQRLALNGGIPARRVA